MSRKEGRRGGGVVEKGRRDAERAARSRTSPPSEIQGAAFAFVSAALSVREIPALSLTPRSHVAREILTRPLTATASVALCVLPSPRPPSRETRPILTPSGWPIMPLPRACASTVSVLGAYPPVDSITRRMSSRNCTASEPNKPSCVCAESSPVASGRVRWSRVERMRGRVGRTANTAGQRRERAGEPGGTSRPPDSLNKNEHSWSSAL